MEAWSPFRATGSPKGERVPRARGRRRQRPSASPGQAGDILTDRDAAQAAESARQARTRPLAPAWERFSSVPVNPPRRQADAADTILTAAQAELDGAAAVRGKATAVTTANAAGRDYGTGPAYEPANMR